ncbi:MAG TPA: DUF1552 domain-containing protein [Alphaproteobacteria bacterium]|nr:DUF1552 domain-containing protein [Alphaproteobacteria bacterium]
MASIQELSRRRVLRGMLAGSAVTVGLPFLDCFLNTNGTALADGAQLPTVFLNWFFGCGFNPGRWEPSQPGKLTELGPELKALEPFKDKINIFSGFKVPLDGKPGLPHITGPLGVTTGMVPASGQKVTLPSVDTLVADAIGGKTRFRSLEVSCIGVAGGALSRRADNMLNPNEVSPAALYTRIFGPDFRDPNAADFKPDPRVMARQSVLSGVKEQLAEVQVAVGSADKARMDEYLTSLRQLEQQLELELQKPAPLEACSVPKPTEGAPQPGTEVETALTNHRLFMALLANAVACGQTRVLNVALTEGLSTLHKAGSAVVHHTHTHEEPVDPSLGYQPQVTWFIEKIASAMVDMVSTLDSFHEGGGTLLDRMLVWITTDTGYAKLHSLDNIPMLTAGRAGGLVKTGLHVRTAGDPVSRMGLTVQQAMGVQVNSWGSDSMETSKTVTEIMA